MHEAMEELSVPVIPPVGLSAGQSLQQAFPESIRKPHHDTDEGAPCLRRSFRIKSIPKWSRCHMALRDSPHIIRGVFFFFFFTPNLIRLICQQCEPATRDWAEDHNRAGELMNIMQPVCGVLLCGWSAPPQWLSERWHSTVNLLLHVPVQ